MLLRASGAGGFCPAPTEAKTREMKKHVEIRDIMGPKRPPDSNIMYIVHRYNNIRKLFCQILWRDMENHAMMNVQKGR